MEIEQDFGYHFDKTGHQFIGFVQVSDLKKSFQRTNGAISEMEEAFTSLPDLSVKFWLELELMFGRRP
jgi:hypothetical protein